MHFLSVERSEGIAGPNYGRVDLQHEQEAAARRAASGNQLPDTGQQHRFLKYCRCTLDWRHWERHSDDCVFVMLFQGKARLVAGLGRNGAPPAADGPMNTIDMSRGSVVAVPRRIWFRLENVVVDSDSGVATVAIVKSTSETVDYRPVRA